MPRYGFGKFLLDAILVILTSGLWLIWIFVREMRKRPRNPYYGRPGYHTRDYR